MAVVKSPVWLPGLASVKVATTTGPLVFPSTALKAGPAVARNGASDTVVVPLSVVLLPPTSLIATVMLFVPSSAYWCVRPLIVKLPPPLAVTAPEVKAVVLLSPQLIVPEKSLVGALGLPSGKVAVRLLGFAPSTPPVAVTVPAVKAASETLVVPLSVVLLPPTSLIVTVMLFVPSSAYWCVKPLIVKLPPPLAVTAPEVKAVVLLSPQLIVPEKSLVGAAVLASLKVALKLVAVSPSTPPVAVTVPAARAASETLVVPLSVVLLPPTSLIATVMLFVPSSAYWCVKPLIVKLPPPLAVTAPEVKAVVLLSPQLIVPEKSLVGALGLPSVKVALKLVAVSPSTPPVAVTVPAVKAASETLAGVAPRLPQEMS